MKKIYDKYKTNKNYIEIVKDMTIRDIAKKYCEDFHLPKFLFVRPLVDLSYHLCMGKDREIEKLKKENAELKKNYEVLSCSVGDFDELQNKLEEEQRKNNELSDNLTNAKEIIKKFLLWENDWHDKTESKYELLKQAEQFIKDNEVEK